MKDKLYKITAHDGASINGGDGRWRLNRWRGVHGKLVPCKNGLHLCRVGDLTQWVSGPCVIWECEHDDELIEYYDKVVVRRARPIRRIGALGEKRLRLFACWCVRNTPLADGRTVWDLLTDERSRSAVVITERYANGEATGDELRVARDAAWAARNAAWAASWEAARNAGWAASWASWAAGEAAWGAWGAWGAAWGAWGAARAAGGEAAWGAARAAREAALAAGGAAWAARTAWEAQGIALLGFAAGDLGGEQ